jgi:hypothetical protein
MLLLTYLHGNLHFYRNNFYYLYLLLIIIIYSFFIFAKGAIPGKDELSYVIHKITSGVHCSLLSVHKGRNNEMQFN